MDKIQDFMRTPVLFVDAGASAKAAAQQMIQHKVSSLLVKKGEEYVGIVTKTDLVKKVLTEGKDAQTTQVSSLMSSPIITLDHYLPRSQANELMLRKKIKHLPVTEHGKIVGMLTLKDMVV